MQSVVSADGTEIAYEVRGDGQPLVLVHGTAASRGSWRTLPERFADERRVVAVDRRGRGASGDGEEYALQREVEDLHAVLDAVGGDPVLFGHSYGALVALEAASDADLGGLVLYEPALVVGERSRSVERAAEMRDRLAGGDREGAVELFFRGLGGDAFVDEMPVSAVAPIADTVVREYSVVTEYRVGDPGVGVSTLLLVGTESPEYLREGVYAVADRLADVEVATLPGTGHHGLATAPDRITDVVRSCLG